MEKEIYYNNKCVGTAQLQRSGLYYNIYCRCQPADKARYRINIYSKDKTIDLGTCLYDPPYYQISTRLPAKQVDDDAVFQLVCKDNTNTWFYPITLNMPFEHIELLPHAKLVNVNGTLGITNQD